MSRLVLCGLFFIGCSAESVWNPASGVGKLDVLEGVLHKLLLANPHADSQQAKAARKVVADVEASIAIMSNTSTTKEVKAREFKKAIQELTDLQKAWAIDAVKSSNSSAIHSKLERLQKELSEKQALLKKAEGQLKIIKLKKELAEKQLELEGLSEAKMKAKAREQAAQDAASEKEVMDTLAVASQRLKTATTVKKGNAPVALQGILANLKAHAHNVSQSIEVLEGEEKKRENSIEQSVTGPRKAAIAKAMKKKMHRNFQKARAMKESELGELNEAIHGIETGDVRALQSAMTKMQVERKNFEAKAKGDFLH